MTRKSIPPKNQGAAHDLEAHARNCTVCHHPMRADIEEMFLHWRSPEKIARSFKIGYRCIYRHAHATGLYQQRRGNFRFVLETFLERAEEVRVSATEIISAVRAYARINDAGEWIEPPTTHKVVVERAGGPAKPALATIQFGELPSSIPVPNSSVEGNGTEKMLPENAGLPATVLISTTKGAEHEGEPVNRCQTEFGLTC